MSKLDLLMQSLIEKASIEDNKQFGRMSEKTQVVSPKNGMKEVPRNRASHSQEVATSSRIMAAGIAARCGMSLEEVDYQHSLENISLLHDIGHCAFGHSGAEMLDFILKKEGLSEGFSDNNNNLVVIEKNKIHVRDYVLASTIKYPDSLYENQKDKYFKILQDAIDSDRFHFSHYGIDLAGETRTIACQIMDEADRNSYTCSDLSDFLSMGNSLDIEKVKNAAKSHDIGNKELVIINEIIKISKKAEKSEIKRYFGNLKQQFNLNYTLSNDGVVSVDKGLVSLRECLNEISFESYINPTKKKADHQENMLKFVAFVLHAIRSGHYPSKHYRSKIEGTTEKVEKLRAIRDMVSEVSDWYVIMECENLNINPVSYCSSTDDVVY